MLWVRDLDKSLAFYEALGCEVDQRSPDRYRDGKMRFVKVSTGASSGIDLRPDANWRPVDRERGNMQHMNLAIDGVDDIQVVIAELAKKGIKPDFGPEVQGGRWGFDVYDPDNNRIEVRLTAQPRPE